MKKILLSIAALGLGMGLAANVASAEMSFSATGIYQIQGFYVSEGSNSSQGMQVAVFDKNIAMDSDGNLYQYESKANDMWNHLFYVMPELKVNDKITMKSEIRFIDRDVWGNDPAYGNFNNRANQNVNDMWLRQLYMNYDSPIGMWSIGRMLGGAWGSKFLDSAGNRDRIKWNLDKLLPENFGASLIYQKTAEYDAFYGGTDEADAASYYAGMSYKADWGQTDAALWYSRYDKDYNAAANVAGMNPILTAIYGSPVDDYDNTELWLNGNYKFGGFNIASEFDWAFAGTDAYNNDLKSFGFMLDANTQLDAFTLGGLFFWLSGDDDPLDGDNKGWVGRNGVGADYNPFAIATGDYMGLLGPDKNGYLGAVTSILGIPGSPYEPLEDLVGGGNINPGAMALAGYAMYQFDEKLSFNGAVGYIWADKVPIEGIDDGMGWEVDLGLSYKLLDNLTYSATAAYMAPGSMFDDLAKEYNAVAEGLGFADLATGTNNIYLLLHNLTMTF
jgi:hypothetical protein